MIRKRRKRNIFIVITIVLLILSAVITVISIRKTREFLRERAEEMELQLLLWSHPIKYSAEVEKYSREWNSELDIYFIYAVIKVESDFDPLAISSAGARGLMQITEDTFNWISRYRLFERDLEFDDMFVPDTNVRFGTWFLAYLIESYEDRNCVIAAYNAGFYAVQEWLQDERYSEDGVTLIIENIPIAETRHYVNKVNTAYDNYIKLYTNQ
ncbi:MAG: lytic transglycosylase domain-containing protein [Oscillospiraceae bacterium]|nr:lytic transglycosylase domain-containing protein [Oscillospiraceae bacterium]